MYKINDNVIYTFIKSGVIDNVHYDDYPDLYYSIKLNSNDDNKIIQTSKQNLLPKNISKNTLEKGSEIVYIKKYNTKIYNIKNNKYKIFYKNKFKYVSEDKLDKI